MIERILGLGILIGLFIRDVFGFGRFDEAIMILGSLLGFIYLFANWWLHKPVERNARTVIVSILYGFASWNLTFAIIFKLLYLSGSDEMSIMSFIVLAFAIGIDLLSSINKLKVIDSWLKVRFAVLAILVAVLFLIPEDYRISFTYRNFPDFLEYYEANKDSDKFDTIRKNYFSKSSKEDVTS
jgi:hypothetical protein